MRFNRCQLCHIVWSVDLRKSLHSYPIAENVFYECASVGDHQGKNVRAWKVSIVTLNNSNTIVAVHNSDIGSTLKTRIGLVSEVDGSFYIDWGKDKRYGTGFFPRVSMNNDGIVVRVHQSLMREVRYRIGRVNEATKTIDWWQGSQTIEKGYTPAVALTDNGHVVVVYES